MWRERDESFGIKDDVSPHIYTHVAVQLRKAISRSITILWQLVLGICPRGNHRDDDITIVSMTYIMSSVNIHYRQTCID